MSPKPSRRRCRAEHGRRAQADAERRPQLPRGWVAAPARADADHAARRGARRPARVLHRRVDRRLAADPHVRSAAVADWAPLSDSAVKGRNLFAQNGCYVCHSGYSRPQDVREALYFLYPKVSQPGDFYGSDQSPNLLGTERTGPDLSQESGWHPDDWQRAHFYDPRFVDPLSLMPPMKSLFSDTQVEHLISYVETRSGKSGLLRYAGQLYSKHVVSTNQGFAGADRLPGRAQEDPRGRTTNPQPAEGPARGGAQPRADRPRLLALRQSAAGDRAEPDARQGGLPCSGASAATASKATARGPARRSCRRRLPTSPTRTTHAAAATPGPGDFYYRILRGWPGTGMENFGDRLSVDDIWRVVLFVKTIPNHTLKKERHPRAEGLHRLAALEGAAGLAEDAPEARRTTRRFDKKEVTDPFMQEAMRVFPGLAPVTSSSSTTARRRSRSRTRRRASRRSTRTCSTARGPRRKHAATSCRPPSQKDIPPTVPGQQ